MRARSFLALCFFSLVAAAPACADGTADDPIVDIAAAMPGGPCASCPAGHVCSANQCVPDTSDVDHDGFTAKVDCDDHDPTAHPGAKESCNGKDDNCDGKIDEGFDADGDGWVSCAVGPKRADCDDKDALVNPGASEVCNGKDDNCDGKIDESEDRDHDGFVSCAKGGAPSDCNDDDPNVKPGATEICNGKDDNCDGEIDEIPATLEGSLVPPVNPHWVLAGSAAYSNGWVQLTPEQTYKAGALWWNATYLFDTFELTATVWMPERSDCADGMAFAFVPGAQVPATGESGYGYGAKGLGGLGIVIDTFSNPGEPTAPFLVVFDAQSGAHLSRQSIPEVRDAKDHKLRVKLDAGKLSVWLDSVAYVSDFTIPGYAPFTGHWGFTAGTGGQTCAHYVRNVTMSFPRGQGCVP